MIDSVGRIIAWGLLIGFISFAAGFFGPIILAPDANQGPLLGILVTGPLGTLAGFGIGIVREVLGYRTGPVKWFASKGIDVRLVRRFLAGAFGTLLVFRGLMALPEAAGRPAAASIVVGAALLWYAAGRSPAWFRR